MPGLQEISLTERNAVENVLRHADGKRFQVIHLERSDFEYYTIAIEDGRQIWVLFADVENVELVNKSSASLRFTRVDPLDKLLARYSSLRVEPTTSEDKAWMALAQGSTLRIAVPNPAADFDWPSNQTVSNYVETLEFE